MVVLLAIVSGCVEYTPVSGTTHETILEVTPPSGSPSIQVEPSSIDFGQGAIGVPTTSDVTVTNIGDAVLTVRGATFESSDGTMVLSWLEENHLQPGELGTLGLSWSPVVAGPWENALIITSDDPLHLMVDVPLVGDVGVPLLDVSPDAWDFGTLAVGAAATVVLTISNVGTAPATITSYEYQSNDGDLALTDPGDLANGSVELAPSASTRVVVTYTPTSEGLDEGALRVRANNGVSEAIATQEGTATSSCGGFVVAASDDSVRQGAVTPLMGGADLPGGTYRVWYSDGCLKYSPTQWWTIHARLDGETTWWLVEPDSGDELMVLPGTEGFLPGTSTGYGDQDGYSRFGDCVHANRLLGFVEFEHVGGPLGLWLADSPYTDNVLGKHGRNPAWCIEPV